MSMKNGLIKSALAGGVASLVASGFVTPVYAGAIDMDFTAMTPTSTTVTTDGPATIPVDLAPFGFGGFNLNVSGYRSGAPDQYDANNATGGSSTVDLQTGKLRLMMDGNGLGVCSDLQTTYNSGGGRSPGTSCADAVSGPAPLDGNQVDGKDLDEWIGFVIDPAIAFAVQTITFGRVGNDDHVTMYYGDDPQDSIDFDIIDNDDYYSSCDTGDTGADDTVCVVDVYKLIAEEFLLTYDPDNIDYDAGLDEIFAFLASPDGFVFQAGILEENAGQDDDWFIRGAKWVVADAPPGVPEPMTLTLLGAGLMGAAWMRRRRA